MDDLAVSPPDCHWSSGRHMCLEWLWDADPAISPGDEEAAADKGWPGGH
jgi:hypothetical protein